MNNLVRIDTPEDLVLFKNSVAALAKMLNYSESYVTQVLVKSKSMGLKNPVEGFNMFWEIGGKAEPKNSVVNAILVERQILVEPLEIIQDAEIQYYYYDGDLKLLIKKYLDKMTAANLLSQEKYKVPVNDSYLALALSSDASTCFNRNSRSMIDKPSAQAAILSTPSWNSCGFSPPSSVSLSAAATASMSI